MSKEWLIASEPSPEHLGWAASGRFLFASPSWAKAIESLGAKSLYAWSPTRKVGAMVPVFRQLGFRIGFLGFPVTGEALDGLSTQEMESLARAVLAAGRLNLIRVTCGNRKEMVGPVDAARPDVWIEDLTSSEMAGKRLRRDLAFARRAAADLRIVAGLVDPMLCFELYAAIVRAHDGSARYTPAYFRELASIPEQSETIYARSAVDAAGRLRAFAVMARHGAWAYYLHGAADQSARRKGISDLLLADLIQRARQMGCRKFSFMSSPWTQPGLVKFKEKWGDRRGLAVTRDIGRGVVGIALRAATRWKSRHDRCAAADWTDAK